MIQYFNYNIKTQTSFGISTYVKEWISFNNISNLQHFIKERDLNAEPHFIIGGGSNLLFVHDYNGLIITPRIQGIELLEESDKYIYIKAGAGVIWDDFVKYCIEHQYWGAENLSLIPGTVGASPVQNIGAYGVEAQDIIFDVRAISKITGELKIFSFEDCHFNYRNSFFKQDPKQEWIITEVVYRLHKKPKYNLSYGALNQVFKDQDQVQLQEIREEIIKIRDSKLPKPEEIGNAGSFFKNPIVDIEIINQLQQDFPQIPYYLTDIDKAKLAAGWLIEHAGWKGYTDGQAGVHEKQALVLINKGKASGKDIFNLSEKIVDSVKKQFNINLEKEVIIIN